MGIPSLLQTGPRCMFGVLHMEVSQRQDGERFAQPPVIMWNKSKMALSPPNCVWALS